MKSPIDLPEKFNDSTEDGESSEADYLPSKLLENPDHEALLGQAVPRFERRKWIWGRPTLVVCAHFTVFSLYIITMTVLVVSNLDLRMKVRSTSLHSPANEAIKWSVAAWPSGDGLSEPYVGYPRPELEKAWQGLLENMNIRISKEDVQYFGREETAVALPDGSGYIGTLNIYHEIHCIRWLHKHLYQEIYWPKLDDLQREKNRVHSEHCLSTLRKFALCHGDVGLITYSWNPHHEKPSANATAHQCIDWDALSRWTAKRSVNMFQPGLLIHPTLGQSGTKRRAAKLPAMMRSADEDSEIGVAYPDGEPLHGASHEEDHTLSPIPLTDGIERIQEV